MDGILRLIEGIILGVLDKVSISGKWIYRDISLKTLEQKKAILNEMAVWFKDPKWDIWLDIYCDYYDRNKRAIKSNFERMRRSSVRYVNKRIKNKTAKITADNI